MHATVKVHIRRLLGAVVGVDSTLLTPRLGLSAAALLSKTSCSVTRTVVSGNVAFNGGDASSLISGAAGDTVGDSDTSLSPRLVGGRDASNIRPEATPRPE